MAMGTRKDQEQQEEMWIPQAALPKGPSHPFYQRLNQLLEEQKFDRFVEGRCRRFYAKKRGRPSLAPGVMGDLRQADVKASYFEIDSELGHSASGPEHAKWSPVLREFLAPLIAKLGLG